MSYSKHIDAWCVKYEGHSNPTDHVVWAEHATAYALDRAVENVARFLKESDDFNRFDLNLGRNPYECDVSEYYGEAEQIVKGQ